MKLLTKKKQKEAANILAEIYLEFGELINLTALPENLKQGALERLDWRTDKFANIIGGKDLLDEAKYKNVVSRSIKKSIKL
jgi:hypothetical protein